MGAMEGGVPREAWQWWNGLGRGKQVVALAFLLAPLFLLLWRDGRYLALLVFGMPGLWFGFRVGFLRFIDREACILLLLVWLFLAVSLLAWGLGGFTDDGLERFDRHNRLILFLPWLISLIWLQPPERLIWALLAVTGLVIVAGGLVEVWQAGEGFSHRVEGDAHAMSFALSCTVLAAILAGGTWQYRATPAFALFLLLGAVAATLAMVMTGVRAGVLGLVLGFFALAICFGAFRDRRGLLVFLVAPVVLGLLVFTFAAEGMKTRMGQGFEQVEEYLGVEAAMPPREEARAGCQDDARLLSANLMADAVTHKGRVEVLTGEKGAACGAGTRYRLEAGNDDPASLRLPRQMLRSAEDRNAVVHARGEGARVGVQGGEQVAVPREAGRLELPSDGGEGDFLEISLAPGGWVEFTPDARWAGEYRYPHVDRSMNKRMEMWRLALRAFAEKPFFGHGTGSFNQLAHTWVAEGKAAPTLTKYDHAHSEYIDALATRGLVGFLSLMMLLGGLVWACYRRVSKKDGGPDVDKPYRGGIPFAAGWVAMAGIFLTEASLSMNLNAIAIALFLAMALYLAHRGRQPDNWQHNRLRFY